MKEVKIGIVGAGGQRCCFHGGCMFSNTKKVKVAALCDNLSDRLVHAKAMYEKYLGYKIATYLDYNEMYAKAGLDAVFVAGPNNLHKDMAVSAFENGLHVLCEKPMEITLKKADAIAKAAKKAGKVLGLAMQMHYRRRYYKVKEIIDSGMIGQVAQVWCTEYRPPFIAMKNWVWNSAESGGAIFEKNCHHYDIMDMWVQSMPTTVYASGNTLKHIKPYGFNSDIVDNAWIINDYENGARGMVGINFMGSDKQKHFREFGVIGTEGKIFFDWEDGEKIHVSCADGNTEVIEAPGEIREGMFQDFIDCVITGNQPLVTPEMGRRSLLVPMAAELSIKEKRIVHVNELK